MTTLVKKKKNSQLVAFLICSYLRHEYLDLINLNKIKKKKKENERKEQRKHSSLQQNNVLTFLGKLSTFHNAGIVESSYFTDVSIFQI